jgi:DUF1365 family protein
MRLIPEAALYTGTLRHRRFRPRQHAFTYKLFMAWLDIDRIPESMANSPWTSYNRFNWASFHDRDHFGNAMKPLRERVTEDARAIGVPLPDGPIFLLTHLRYLGYCFNPISLYFCYGRDGSLETVLAEVNSTFGESRNYWLWPGNRDTSKSALHYRCPKTMHVSPFLSMDLDYEFVLTEPGEKLLVHMNTLERGAGVEQLFDATLTLQRRPWTAGNIAAALLRHPWMTAQVTVAIHWQALRLFLQGNPLFRHPGQSRSKWRGAMPCDDDLPRTPAVTEASKRS